MTKSKTATLTERIEALSEDCVKKWTEIQALEEKLTNTYAEGGDAATVQKKLQTAKSDFESMRASLDKLDQKLIVVSHEENKARREELRKHTGETYRKVAGDLEKALGKLSSVVEKHLTKADAQTMVRKITEAMRAAAWESINSGFSEKYIEYVPAIVHHAPRRMKSGAMDDRPDFIARKHAE